jgi:hypothetical protein
MTSGCSNLHERHRLPRVLDGRLLVQLFSSIAAVDPPLFRMKDDRPGTAMLVYLACSEPVLDGDGRRYTNMYETTNETNRRPVTVVSGRSR